jgi:hypothetical protein
MYDNDVFKVDVLFTTINRPVKHIRKIYKTKELLK